jgi:hypothetical protein
MQYGTVHRCRHERAQTDRIKGTTMTEGRWSERSKSPAIDWHMSAALENVPRGDGDLAEVTSLEQAVRVWLGLDPHHRADAKLTPERPVLIDGVPHELFYAEGIAALAERLPATSIS